MKGGAAPPLAPRTPRRPGTPRTPGTPRHPGRHGWHDHRRRLRETCATTRRAPAPPAVLLVRRGHLHHRARAWRRAGRLTGACRRAGCCSGAAGPGAVDPLGQDRAPDRPAALRAGARVDRDRHGATWRARADLACGGFDEIGRAGPGHQRHGRPHRAAAGDQRELLAGVSHELRTPLARLRVLLDIARDARAPAPRTWDELERELMEMDALVGELLASARLDFQALTRRPLDARRRRHAGRWSGRACPPTSWSARRPARPFAGDPTLVGARAGQPAGQRRASTGAGSIACGWASGRASSCSRCWIGAPGSRPTLLEKLFHPFVQSAPGVGEGHGGPSLGLGLALVPDRPGPRRLVRAENRAGGGAQLVLELAEQPPAPAVP